MGEVEAWTVATGNIPAKMFLPKKVKQALDLISEQEGLIGLHPVPQRGTLWLFRTENDAKIARNNMRAAGIETGCNIVKVYIDERYVKETKE